MAFDTYANFRTSVGTWLNATDLTTSQLDDIITVGENKANKDLRVRLMEKAFSVVIDASGNAALPSDYIEAKFLRMSRTSPEPTLERVTLERLFHDYPDRNSAGDELLVARDGSNLVFGPAGTQGRTVAGTYYYEPTSMPSVSTITTVFASYPEVYLFAALSEAEQFLGRDARVPIWQQKYQEVIARANGDAQREDHSGSPLRAITR